MNGGIDPTSGLTLKTNEGPQMLHRELRKFPGPDRVRKPGTDCWLHPGIDVRESPIEGRGLFARQPLPAGTVVSRLGGRLVSRAELRRLIADPRQGYVDTITVTETEHLVLPPRRPNGYGNHSCDPNLWWVGPYELAARRAIAVGEELTNDYATSTADPDFAMACGCGSPLCRGMVTGTDWRRPELTERYGEHWIPMLLALIRRALALNRVCDADPVSMVTPMTLSHDVAGDGPTVVLLHSTVCDRRMWEPQLPVLAEAGFRVVRCDFRGFGESPMPDGPASDAGDVVGLMDELGAEQVTLVAASGGGRVALEIAATQPQRVTALALLCTAWAGHDPGPDLQAFGAREDELLEAGDLAGATELNVQTWLGPEADEATRDQVRLMQRHAFEVQLAATEDFPSLRTEPDPATVTARTLLVSGAHDLSDFRQIAAELAGRITGSHLVELDWAGHLPSLERPDLLNPLLLDFLRQ